ncbi:MAG: metal ABC transporter permease [Microthrixaceae bacterium]
MVGLLAMAPVEWLVDPFTGSVTMQRALAAGTLAAIACGLVGTWVVLRGMTFIGDALAHGVLPGLAIATIVGFNPTLGALASAGVMIGGITVIGRRSRLAEDTAIGLLFVGMLALGVLIVSRSRSFAGDLTGFLFGGITSITTGDLLLGAAVAAGVLVTVVVGYRAFLVLCFNASSAKLLGLRPGFTHAVLLLLVTLTVVASFKTVGSLLVFALITAPSAAAVQLVRRVPWVLVTSVVFAELSVVVGLLLAWHARLAAGAAMATSAVAIFLVTLLVSEVRRVVRSRRSGRSAVAAS